MTQLYSMLGDNLVNALGWTFVHSLWQGSLIALIMTAVLSRVPAQQARRRYTISTLSMLSVLICSVITFALLYQKSGNEISSGNAYFSGLILKAEESNTSLYSWISQYNPFLVSIWIMGVMFFALRFCFGLLYLRHLKSTATSIPSEWQESLNRIIKTIGYQRSVRLAQSTLLRIPIVAGYLKPVILFPVSIINQLQVEEVEAILAHEVAHLVRNDFVQNLVQSLIEMIFYYHPAVWWISAVVRSERENCCDDLAVQVCSNTLTYAKALVRLEDISYHAPALALPFAGSKGHLLNRIKRILNQPQNKSNIMERIIATVILIGCVTLLSFSERQAQAQSESKDVEVITEYHYEIIDTVPQQQREVTVWRTVEGKEIEMRSQNGEISSLKIDGKVIDPSEYDAHQAEIEKLRAMVADAPSVPSLPPVPPIPPVPPVPAMAPVPPMPPMPPMPAVPPMPPMPAFPGEATFEYELFTPEPTEWQNGGSNKTTIIREKSGDGYTYHVEGEGNTNVMIDSDRGIVLVNGQEIELDADSVFIIEQNEGHGFSGAYAPHRIGNADAIILHDGMFLDQKDMTEEQKAEWKAYERSMEDWAKQWEKNAKGFEGAEWDAYNKQMEEWAKQFGENQDWKAYEDQWKVYGEQWEKEHAGEWKVYGEQLKQYQEQLAEMERNGAHEDLNKALIEQSLRLHELDREQLREERGHQEPMMRRMEEMDAIILQRSNDGNVIAVQPRYGREPFRPITSAMDREGLIDSEGNYSIILEEDKLRINGKRMPDEVHEQYLDLFERTQGYRLSGKSKIEISND